MTKRLKSKLDPLEEEHIDHIRSLIKAGHFDEADRLCQEALTMHPAYPPFWAFLGDIESARGNVEAASRAREGAIQALRVLREKAGEAPILDAMEMENLVKEGRFLEGQGTLERIQADHPNEAITHLALGGAYFEQQRLREARREWERAFELAVSPKEQEIAMAGLQCLVAMREKLLARCAEEGVTAEDLANQNSAEGDFIRIVLETGDLAKTQVKRTWKPQYFDLEFVPKRGYWPRGGFERVTIARAFINSSGGEYILFWAQPTSNGVIEYGISDSDDMDQYIIFISTSSQPLTLGEVFWQINNSEYKDCGEYSGMGVLKAILTLNMEGCGPDELMNYIDVESNYYPELPSLYQYEIRRFLTSKQRFGYSLLTRRKTGLPLLMLREVRSHLRRTHSLHRRLAQIRRAHV